MKKIFALIISMAGTLAVGGLSALFTGDSFNMYSVYEKPFLAPPSILFPIVWTVLYVLMGISVYFIYSSDCPNRDVLIEIYIIQLTVNFIWPLIFFKWQLFFVAFIWLILLWILIVIMTIMFYKCKKIAGYLLIPYIIWVAFAGYLNFMVYILN